MWIFVSDSAEWNSDSVQKSGQRADAKIVTGCTTALPAGKKYLPYWYALLDSQKQTVQALLETYRAEGVRDYEDFMEYRQEKHLLDAYREMTQTILESER